MVKRGTVTALSLKQEDLAEKDDSLTLIVTDDNTIAMMQQPDISVLEIDKMQT